MALPPSPLETFPKLRKWAVVGVSADKSKYGNKIYLDLKEGGYQVYGVNPKLESIEGDPCYGSLSALPEVPEVVNIVVPPAAGLSVVEECLALGVKNIWFQPGAESDEAIERAEKAGMNVVANACIMLQKHAWA
ncbi:MAG: CoA-binding protein [Vampirovibrionales bacterium]|nr:CoA-binding protein [Vampirovibrionales bacterium]